MYKAGRTAPGIGGVMGHTASIAGDSALFDSVVRHAGAIVAEDFDRVRRPASTSPGALHGKKIGGNRLGAISGAGFEAVGMADSIESETSAMEMGALEPETVQRVEEILAAKRLDALVEVSNPIDINPGADDEAHLQITEAFLAGSGHRRGRRRRSIPTAPAVRALEAEQAAARLRHQRSEEHRAPDAAARRAQRQADHRHRRRRAALRRDVRGA